jgi:hypothetical protein
MGEGCSKAGTSDAVFGELLFRDMTPGDSRSCKNEQVRDLVILFIHFIVTLACLLGSGGWKPTRGFAHSMASASWLILLKYCLTLRCHGRKITWISRGGAVW